MRQIPLPIGPRALPDLDNFVPGANAAALEHLRALTATAVPGAPVYLWGVAGSGKTHLLRAAAARWRAAGTSSTSEVGGAGDDAVVAFDAADPTPWHVPPGATLATIDRCEALSPAAQHAAFSVFVDAATQGVQVIAAGRLPPVDLDVRDDLRTRLGWGPVYALEPLSEEATRTVLRREAAGRGIRLSDDVVEHLLTRFDRDLSHLIALLDRVDRYALSRSRPVTVPLVRQMLLDEGGAARAVVAPLPQDPARVAVSGQ